MEGERYQVLSFGLRPRRRKREGRMDAFAFGFARCRKRGEEEARCGRGIFASLTLSILPSPLSSLSPAPNNFSPPSLTLGLFPLTTK